ncbi:MAG: GAP family protein [Rhodococcus sp. (in: high G+C Gram-positive bacteria)]|uniref:GAP family protein n=1 Tax=Rhodococcus sp. TaxID=1831 RepID=UPI002AD7CEDF|nr:GAP family protein [Rhodococcus sp. (in: high G+C Gram-positive bacteria)]MDZ7928950.1 GAP family protein [Rhodococcus sp. (in: high G+C Gram-positive bacteria)]
MLIQLTGLALVDSIGVGTLAVPLWMMLRQSFRARVVLLHLGVLGLLYLGVGIAVWAAADGLSVVVPGDARVRLAVGLAVLAVGLVFDRRRRGPSGARWTRPPVGVRGVVLLAAAVGAVEVATMLPYFAAIDAVGDAGLGWGSSSLLLVAYVLVTLSPALVLLSARVLAQEYVSSIMPTLLRRVDRWSGGAAATVLLVVGALLAADAAIELNLV